MVVCVFTGDVSGVLLEQWQGGEAGPADQSDRVSVDSRGSRVLAGTFGALGPAVQGALPAGECQWKVDKLFQIAMQTHVDLQNRVKIKLCHFSTIAQSSLLHMIVHISTLFYLDS